MHSVDINTRPPHHELLALLWRCSVRIAVVEALTTDYQSIKDIAEQADTTAMAVGAHLRALVGAGAVEKQVPSPSKSEGYYRLNFRTEAGQTALFLGKFSKLLKVGSVA